MIDIVDKKYGQIKIIELEDTPGYVCNPITYWGTWLDNQFNHNYSVIAFRDIDGEVVKLVKNRYGPLEDYETEQFILNYGKEVEEIFESINSRFDILDLRER